MKKIVAALIGAGFVLGAAPAFAGEWRLDERRCPDIREDWRDARDSRRDERVDYSRYDRREDRYDRRDQRRDRRITICPRSAFYYVDGRGRSEDRRHDWRNDDRREDWRRDDRRRQPPLKTRYDRAVGMQYVSIDGRRIYLRG